MGLTCLCDLCACVSLAICPGYTPLHMASGYMHTGPMAALLEGGADPLIKDKQGERRERKRGTVEHDSQTDRQRHRRPSLSVCVSSLAFVLHIHCVYVSRSYIALGHPWPLTPFLVLLLVLLLLLLLFPPPSPRS